MAKMKRSTILKIRLSDDEADKLAAGAALKRFPSIARYVRQAALDACGAEPSSDDVIATLSLIGSQLRRLTDIVATVGIALETDVKLQEALRLTIAAITRLGKREAHDDREDDPSDQVA